MNTTKIFVYGTLMRGEAANYMLDEAKYLGKYRLADYAMYRVQSFPGIVAQKGESVVGEVYEVSKSILIAMDHYECEGSLYLRKEVVVANENETHRTYVYVYNREVIGKELLRERWNANDEDYVWYAAYGSNLNRERFRNYIEGGIYELTGKYCEGCRNKKGWIDERVKVYNGEMYYGNESGSWEGKGVAFFDSTSNDKTKMRLYKITREQLHDIQCNEGKSANWYGKCECLDVLLDGCEVYTLTSENKRPLKAPCDKYYKLIVEELEKI